ncbi:fibronectin type III domain-containing protein [Planomonospora sp. ID82291]|uniref:fibronectin type III domain-containing protein n=1 Tax=Planomonospora sp. ID82291 TaxID=2738136 RepID=UPI0018C3AE6B|nr:fibronectin type III domain-containing protein [Planomonospora sp. ID82291]MBG0818247.1 fibronectin type III domain-containing protein [Planomonospora sp. ID82291]
MARLGRGTPAPRIIVTAPVGRPDPPRELRVSATSSTSIAVAWDAPEGGVGPVVGYGVYLDAEKVGDDVAALSHVFTGLTDGTLHTIWVDAVNDIGNRSGYAVLGAATTDTTPPTAPLNLRVGAVTETAVELVWDAAADGVAVAGYGVYRDGSKIGGDEPALTAWLAGLEPGVTYSFGVDAVDLTGNRSSAAIVLTTTLPSPPADLHVIELWSLSVTVGWSPAISAAGIAGYGVYLDGVQVADDVLGLSHLVDELELSSAYRVEVDAKDTLGRCSAKVGVDVETLGDQAPDAPEVTVEAFEESLLLTWERPREDVEVTRYNIWLDGTIVGAARDMRVLTPGGEGPGWNSAAYTITDLVGDTDYTVGVSAIDNLGQESPIGEVPVATLPPSYTPIATPVYRLGAWSANVRDVWGVEWAVETEEGWSSSPQVRAASREAGGRSGGIAGPGLFSSRLVTLSGTAVAPSRVAMLQAKQRLLSALPPTQVGLLRVVENHLRRRARVRLLEQVEITDTGPHAFAWTIRLRAADPRRYALTPTRADAMIDTLPGVAEVSILLEGDYPYIPATLRLYGPIRDWQVRHVESGGLLQAVSGGSIPANPDYSVEIDLGTRSVTAHVPVEIWPEPRPGRALLRHPPGWFTLQPGLNTLQFEGAAVVGEVGRPRLLVETQDAWN